VLFTINCHYAKEKGMSVDNYLRKQLGRQGKAYVIGCLAEVRVADVDALLKSVKMRVKGVEVQLFDADRIAGRRHLEFAVLNALSALNQGYNISRSLPVEIMLYTSAQRQIQRAIELVGVTPETQNIAFILIGDIGQSLQQAQSILREATQGITGDGILESRSEDKLRELMEAYNISRLELETERLGEVTDADLLTSLILEKMALLVARS